MTTRILGLACLISILVTACGGGGNGAPPASPAAVPAAVVEGGTEPVVEACSLLDDDAIRELTTYGVASATPGPAMGIFANGCEWTMDGGAQMGAPAELTLGVVVPGGRAMWDRNFAPFMDEPGRSRVDGLGDGAFTDTADSLTIVRGDALVSIQYLDGDGDAALLERIGRRILDALAVP